MDDPARVPGFRIGLDNEADPAKVNLPPGVILPSLGLERLIDHGEPLLSVDYE